jgi:hypothetical protein
MTWSRLAGAPGAASPTAANNCRMDGIDPTREIRCRRSKFETFCAGPRPPRQQNLHRSDLGHSVAATSRRHLGLPGSPLYFMPAGIQAFYVALSAGHRGTGS